MLVLPDLITLDMDYIDGTKIESKANKYTFVWRKSKEKIRAKLINKIKLNFDTPSSSLQKQQKRL